MLTICVCVILYIWIAMPFSFGMRVVPMSSLRISAQVHVYVSRSFGVHATPYMHVVRTSFLWPVGRSNLKLSKSYPNNQAPQQLE